MHINTVQMVSFELFPHKFNLSAIFGLRNLHFCCCGVHGEFLNDDNVNYMAVVEIHAANFIQFWIEMTYRKVTRINKSRSRHQSVLFMHLKWLWLLRFFAEIQNHRKI